MIASYIIEYRLMSRVGRLLGNALAIFVDFLVAQYSIQPLGCRKYSLHRMIKLIYLSSDVELGILYAL
jgi:hypothetical protein